MTLTILKDFAVESNGRWAAIPLATTNLGEAMIGADLQSNKISEVWMRKIEGQGGKPYAAEWSVRTDLPEAGAHANSESG